MKFQVGDQIQIVIKEPGVFFDVGDVVEVVSVNSSGPACLYGCRRISDGRVQFVAESQLSPIESTVVKHSFKVDDKVKVISRRPINANMSPRWVDSMDCVAGKIGTVKRTTSDGVITVDFGGVSWNFRPEWLSPMKESYLMSTIVAPLASVLKVSGASHRCATRSTTAVPLIEINKLLTDINLD